MNESCHTCGYDYVIKVTRMNESCHTYEWVMSHIWISHATHTWMSHDTYVNESRHIYEWIMSHIWMSRVMHMWHGSFIQVWNGDFKRQLCYFTWHDLFIQCSWHYSLIQVWHLKAIMLPCVSSLTYTMYVTWLMYTMYGHDSFIQSTWHDSLRQIWNRDILRQLCYRVCHDSFIHCMDMTHSYNVLEITQ